MIRLIPLVLVMSSLCVADAASFQNLGFDDANTNNVRDPDGIPPIHLFGPASEVLPGWQLFRGGVPQTEIGLNHTPIGGGVASLYDRQSRDALPVSGSYSFAMYPEMNQPYSLVQMGAVPLDA